MKRRDFLRSTGAACVGAAFSKAVPLFAGTSGTGNSDSAAWRTYEVTARVEVLKPSGATHIWLPAALIHETPYQKTISNRFTAEGGTAKLTTDKQTVLGIVSAAFPVDKKPVLMLTSRVSLKPYTVDLSTPHKPHASRAEVDYFLQPSK